ncbi:hypothetical protein WJX72_008833 [[Myrmecia] bisecta]|uniref:Uncharacterized protein n=1 Tax=[Myrmecia] bisecta TaxID=41462 RepID=A0AAW1PPC5_9CHLO
MFRSVVSKVMFAAVMGGLVMLALDWWAFRGGLGIIPLCSIPAFDSFADSPPVTDADPLRKPEEVWEPDWKWHEFDNYDPAQHQGDDVCSAKPGAKQTRRIPKIVHFVFGMREDFGGSPWNFIHYMTVVSAHKRMKPDAMYVHYVYLPSGHWWQESLPMLTPVRARNVTAVYGHAVKHPAHKADVIRLEMLYKHGGIYLDLDVLVFQSFDALLHNDFIISYEGSPEYGLGNSIMASRPRSKFVERWLSTYVTFNSSGNWAEHSIFVPRRLSMVHSTELCILPPHSFLFPLWSDKGRKIMFEEPDGNGDGPRISTYTGWDGMPYTAMYPGQYAYHMAEHSAWEKYLQFYDLDYIRSHNDRMIFLKDFSGQPAGVPWSGGCLITRTRTILFGANGVQHSAGAAHSGDCHSASLLGKFVSHWHNVPGLLSCPSSGASDSETAGSDVNPRDWTNGVEVAEPQEEQEDEDNEGNESEDNGPRNRSRKPHLQGRFSGRLETKGDEKKLADECRLLGPLLGGQGKRGEKSRLTLAKIVRGIACGDVRKHCEAREALIKDLRRQLDAWEQGGNQQMSQLQAEVESLRGELEHKLHVINEMESERCALDPSVSPAPLLAPLVGGGVVSPRLSTTPTAAAAEQKVNLGAPNILAGQPAQPPSIIAPPAHVAVAPTAAPSAHSLQLVHTAPASAPTIVPPASNGTAHLAAVSQAPGLANAAAVAPRVVVQQAETLVHASETLKYEAQKLKAHADQLQAEAQAAAQQLAAQAQAHAQAQAEAARHAHHLKKVSSMGHGEQQQAQQVAAQAHSLEAQAHAHAEAQGQAMAQAHNLVAKAQAHAHAQAHAQAQAQSLAVQAHNLQAAAEQLEAESLGVNNKHGMSAVHSNADLQSSSSAAHTGNGPRAPVGKPPSPAPPAAPLPRPSGPVPHINLSMPPASLQIALHTQDSAARGSQGSMMQNPNSLQMQLSGQPADSNSTQGGMANGTGPVGMPGGPMESVLSEPVVSLPERPPLSLNTDCPPPSGLDTSALQGVLQASVTMQLQVEDLVASPFGRREGHLQATLENALQAENHQGVLHPMDRPDMHAPNMLVDDGPHRLMAGIPMTVPDLADSKLGLQPSHELPPIVSLQHEHVILSAVPPPGIRLGPAHSHTVSAPN